MTRVRARVGALIAVAVFSAGCATEPTSPAHVERAPTTTTTTTTTTTVADAVPMVLETELPLHVPTAQLIAGRDGREVGQTGFLFRADWATRRSVDRSSPMARRSDWPEPLAIVDPDTATVAINTTALPDWLVLRTYATRPGTLRNPEVQPTEVIECMRFTEPKCKFAMTSSGFRIHYDPHRVFTGSFIVVFGVWHVPSDDQRPDSVTPNEVVASWLFDFAMDDEPKALLP